MNNVSHRMGVAGSQMQMPIIGPQTIVYAFGSNGSGQLGLGHTEDVNVAQEAVLLNLPSDISQVVGGGNHTFVLRNAPPFRSCTVVGTEQPAEMGYDGAQSARTAFGATTMMIDNVLHCAASWDTFAIARRIDIANPNEMVIETFGSSDKGQLGRATKLSPLPGMDNQNAICLVPAVACMAAGVQHFVVVLGTGDVFGWGNGRKGQLGEPSEGVVERPRLIAGLDFKATYAVCGREFTVILGDPAEGRMLILGSDKFGIKSDAPSEAKGWKQIGAGWGTVSILFEDGTIKSWGRNDHGQHAPKGLPPIEQMAVGSEHTIAVTKAAEILAWGWGEHGNCGKDVDANGDVKDRWNVIPFPPGEPVEGGRRVNGIGAGHATSWFWLSRLPVKRERK